MNRIGAVFFCAVLLCASRPACAASSASSQRQEFTARIIAVLDGDTVLVRRHGRPMKIRLAEIDAPEEAQPYGETSKLSLSGMVMDSPVKIVGQTMDQYGRLLAHLSVQGVDVNAEQIRRGMAWEYSNFHSNKALVMLQNQAKQALRGLWEQGHPIPPWKWRKLHPYVKHDKWAIPE